MNLYQQKLQFIGIYGILRETIKLIFTSTKIFSQITLTFILPLSLLIFAQSQFPNPWNNLHSLPTNFALFISSALFFLLSTAAAAFATACTFADREVPFHHLLRAAPKLCKQHLITLLCLIIDFLAFNFIAVFAITLISVPISLLLIYDFLDFLLRFLILLLSVELSYFALIWQIASAVSVFEADSYGFEAVARSKELLRGKMATAAIVLILIGFPFGVILFAVRGGVVVVESTLVEVGIRGILGIVGICSFLMFLLIGNVLYLFCKSCNGESIEKLELSAHLQGYLPMNCEEPKVEDDDELEKSLVV